LTEAPIQRDVIISLLRAASEPMPISDVWRGLQNRGVEIGYTELEDWLLDPIPVNERHSCCFLVEDFHIPIEICTF